MKAIHAGMRITTAEFMVLIEDVEAVLATINILESEQKEQLGLLGPMKSDIVEIP